MALFNPRAADLAGVASAAIGEPFVQRYIAPEDRDRFRAGGRRAPRAELEAGFATPRAASGAFVGTFPAFAMQAASPISSTESEST